MLPLHHVMALTGMTLAWGSLGCVLPEGEKDEVVARAFDRVLPWNELRQVVPIDAAPEDSAAMAQAYIQAWLRQQVLLHKAEASMAVDDQDMQKRLQDYRNSLVIFAYEQALVDQKLDTAISEPELQAYYEQERDNFTLKDNILRLRWFKVRESDKRTLKKLEDHFLSGDPARMREVEVWLAARNIPIVDRSRSWSVLGELRAELPIWPDAPGPGDLREGRMVRRDAEGAFFVDVLELRLKDSVSPLSMVKNDIRAILLNQRKRQLLERMREDIYQEAQANGDVEVLD